MNQSAEEIDAVAQEETLRSLCRDVEVLRRQHKYTRLYVRVTALAVVVIVAFLVFGAVVVTGALP